VALRRRIGNLAEILLKQNLEAQQVEDQDKLIRQRQAELSRQGAEQQILGKVLGDDKGQMVERLLSGGVTSLGGVKSERVTAHARGCPKPRRRAYKRSG
jgi:hypothetical protein